MSLRGICTLLIVIAFSPGSAASQLFSLKLDCPNSAKPPQAFISPDSRAIFKCGDDRTRVFEVSDQGGTWEVQMYLVNPAAEVMVLRTGQVNDVDLTIDERVMVRDSIAFFPLSGISLNITTVREGDLMERVRTERERFERHIEASGLQPISFVPHAGIVGLDGGDGTATQSNGTCCVSCESNGWIVTVCGQVVIMECGWCCAGSACP